MLLLVAAIGLLMAGCDKKDCNGDLDGMWQLMVWTDPSGDTIATKDSMIFYSVQLQMMKFQKETGTRSSILSMFEKYTDAIRVYNPQNYKSAGHDTIYSMKVLSRFGVPEDGVMNVESLSSSELVLSSASKGTLRFRKY